MRKGNGAALSSDDFTQVAKIVLEPGSYVLIARVDLVNLLGFDLDSSQALCELRQVANPVPPLERGTLTSLLDEDASRVFTIALTLTESSQIELACKTLVGSMAVDENPASIHVTAIRVDQLSVQQ